MTTYRDAMKRLQIIYNDCNPQSKTAKATQDKDLDEFTRTKKSLHSDVKQIRLMLKEREELLSVKPGSKEAAEASHRIRSRLKQIREDALKLQNIQKQDEKKGKSAGIDREEIVGLVFKHIEEVEQLEKKRYSDKLSTDRGALFAGAAEGRQMTTFNGRPNVPPPASSDLPDIDADPEVTEGLQALDRGNKDIDKDLDDIQANIGVLREVAINMDRELDKQDAILDNIDKKVDKAQIHLDNVNVKMKQALDGAMKGDKFMVNCILLCVLLCLAGFIANYALKN